MARIATVSQRTTVVTHTGHAGKLPAGRYKVADLDGTTDRGELFLTGPDGKLVKVDPQDPNITIADAGTIEPEYHEVTPDLLARMVEQPEPSTRGDWYVIDLRDLAAAGFTHIQFHFPYEYPHEGVTMDAASLIKDFGGDD